MVILNILSNFNFFPFKNYFPNAVLNTFANGGGTAAGDPCQMQSREASPAAG